MIAKVSKDNKAAWAKLCVSLWPDTDIEAILAESEPQEDFLYFVGEEAVAFISLSLRHDYVEGTETSPVGYLEGIYVKPEYQRQGIATLLLNHGKSWAKENGCTEFASDCELWNEDSRKFHERMGFVEANRIICFAMEL